MPNSRYRKGTRAEKKTVRWLEGQGFKAVDVRGSHGAVDIIATSLTAVVVVQCKSGRQLSRSEFAAARQSLREWPVPAENGARWLVHWADYARDPSVEVVY